jgi:hypothetical protein
MITENIKVFCRPKPNTTSNYSTTPPSIVKVIDDTTCSCLIKNKENTFAYDKVFQDTCSQE